MRPGAGSRAPGSGPPSAWRVFLAHFLGPRGAAARGPREVSRLSPAPDADATLPPAPPAEEEAEEEEEEAEEEEEEEAAAAATAAWDDGDADGGAAPADAGASGPWPRPPESESGARRGAALLAPTPWGARGERGAAEEEAEDEAAGPESDPRLFRGRAAAPSAAWGAAPGVLVPRGTPGPPSAPGPPDPRASVAPARPRLCAWVSV